MTTTVYHEPRGLAIKEKALPMTGSAFSGYFYFFRVTAFVPEYALVAVVPSFVTQQTL